MATPAVVKIVCGVVLAVLVLVVWQQLDDLGRRQQVATQWGDVGNYAVFYPRLVGNDSQELASGGNASAIAQARDLYPVLDKAGALYVDAINYEPHVPDLPPDPSSPWPRPPIRVNTNYLRQYPILDESGHPITVADSEQDWVVAVPAQFKSRAPELQKFFESTRVGGPHMQGAVQGQQKVLHEPVPAAFTHQQVRIVWTAPGQRLFSFDTKVDPNDGYTIADPVVEIMTPANSLTIDRLNVITGEMNPPLKVRFDADPATTLRDLGPLLTRLHLDDNLKYLVTPQEALLTEISGVRDAITWEAVIGAAALLVLLALSVTMVVIGSDRLRRRLIVRRLHGFGFGRTYRELLVRLGVTWLAQSLLAVGVVLAMRRLDALPTEAGTTQIVRVLTVLAVSVVAEALVVVVTAVIVERRNTVKRLKEL
jgi:hypothetical protein